MRLNALILIVAFGVMAGACSNNGVSNLKPRTQDDSLSYALGVDIYHNLKKNNNLEVDPLFMAKGMKDAEEGNSIFIDVAASGYIMMVMQERQEKAIEEQFKDYLTENEAFLDNNSKEEGVIMTESGLQYKVLKMGDGPKPGSKDTVLVHYTGKLIDGTVFDSSYDKDEPAQFRTNALIKGWSEGLQLMPVGSKFMFYVPYDLGYGSRGAGQTIKPFSTLIFEVELLDIVKK